MRSTPYPSVGGAGKQGNGAAGEQLPEMLGEEHLHVLPLCVTERVLITEPGSQENCVHHRIRYVTVPKAKSTVLHGLR